MLRRAGQRPLCSTCSRQLLDLFSAGFAPAPKVFPRETAERRLPLRVRPFHNSRNLRRRSRSSSARKIETEKASETKVPGSSAQQDEQEPLLQGTDAEPVEQISPELRVLIAKQTFGDTLPEGYLSPTEYQIYERLYGAPVAITNPEDEKLLERLDEDDDAELEELDEQNTLFKETDEGDLEEVEYGEDGVLDDEPLLDMSKLLTQQEGETAEQFEQRKTLYETVSKVQDGWGNMDDRTAMFQDLQYADQLAQDQIRDREMQRERGSEGVAVDSRRPTDDVYPEDYKWSEEDLDMDEESDAEAAMARLHPLTAAGRFWTNPRTIRPPAVELTEPVQRHLATTARYEHLTESAHKLFGGPHLPDSNATPRRKNMPMQQKPLALSAFQHSMSTMDANLFMSAIMPGAYSSAKSVIIEVRRRLGSKWLESVMSQPGGPRILDAGAAGAGIIAWREVLDAQWDLMHEGTLSRGPVPYGSSTVLAGSQTLQDAVSKLLTDTSFIPRLPDFNRQRDMPIERAEHEPTRKRYDLIIAPYTLYGMEEDYMKKSQVQNLWSLLDPNGGVLIILEKGIPKGFEAVAAAREVFLKHHINNPAPESQEQMKSLIGNYHTHLEDGMIIAPCTNHKQCPMYTVPGESVGRKDACTFKQRYERPPFLQRIHGAKFHNHEDINFSYIAVQRGKDLRKERSFVQNEDMTTRAFNGYEERDPAYVEMMTLPRILRQPLKRTGHVTLNVCTPHGTLERWTTPKSFSLQAYRDARKSQWGDLWALGAKTRIDTPAKIGRPKNGRVNAKVNFETGAPYEETEEEAAELKRKDINRKRREKRMRKAKLGRQPKYANDTRKKLAEGGEEEEELD